MKYIVQLLRQLCMGSRSSVLLLRIQRRLLADYVRPGC